MIQKDFLQIARALSKRFATRADEVDQTGKFPEKNFEELKEAGFLAFTLPKEYGGQEMPVYEMVRLLECIGEGDASTALSLGWHLGILMELTLNRPWSEEIFAEICHEIVHEQKLMNRLATEPASGSPTRGGKPQTVAYKVGEEWLIKGRKTFASMSYALDLILVTAVIPETGEVGEFLVRKGSPRIKVEETWDALGMRGTASHDMIFDEVPASALLRRMDYKRRQKASRGWLLHIPATYLGIAKAARDYAVKFATTYTPNSISEPIKSLPNIEHSIGKMELEYFTAQTILHSMANRWDASHEERAHFNLAPDLAATKLIVTNSACRIVDLAMRIVGGHSLYKRTPLERYYRDVRGGLHNPPMDDMTIRMMAHKTFE